jgi:DNA mismatch repair endonuclease MutH
MVSDRPDQELRYLCDPFDPRTATETAIMARAEGLVGHPIKASLSRFRKVSETPRGDKGGFGLLVERYFNIAQNSESAPDFTAAAIELKSVPLMRRSRTGGFRAKERTTVSMIDFHALVDERWETAAVRPKLVQILFVFFEHLPGRSVEEFPVLALELWRPDAALSYDLRRDWEVVHHKVDAGLAHEISEGDGVILGAATKGANAAKGVSQPRSPIPARSRAWALKASLTSALYDRIAGAGRRHGTLSLRDELGLSLEADFESEVLTRLNRLAGRTLAEIADTIGADLSNAKGGANRIVRRALGIVDDRVRLKEFDDRGISIKTVPVAPDGSTYEAMSFPYFKYKEYAEERWEDSEFLSHIQRFLMVPILRSTRKTPLPDRVLGRAFFWSPSAKDLDTIRSEWTAIRDLIRAGRADDLPSYGATELIHARPHARDARDVDEAPGLGPLPRHCLWLNPSYTARIVREHQGLQGIEGFGSPQGGIDPRGRRR